MSCPQFVWVPSPARACKSIQVKGVPFLMGVPSEECLGPPRLLGACAQPTALPRWLQPHGGVGLGFGSSSQE